MKLIKRTDRNEITILGFITIESWTNAKTITLGRIAIELDESLILPRITFITY